MSISNFLKFIILVVPFLVSVAFVTLLERKILGLAGVRIGPNKVSLMGLLQPIGDAVKLSNKSMNTLSNFTFFVYYVSSLLLIFSSLVLLSCLFSDPFSSSLKYSFVLFFFFLGLGALNLILCGWSVYSKFSLLGSVRTVSQLISYEASLYLCLLFSISMLLSFDTSSFFWLLNPGLFLLVPYCAYIWLPSVLAELNRTPYDFSEGESELVSGFNTEFGSSCFTLIFLSEYSNILFFCIFSSLIFLSSFNLFFFFLFFVVWIRSVLPRFRFDKLMCLCWKFFIPFLTISLLCFLSLTLY